MSVNPPDTSERAQYADAFAKAVDIKNEINLTDKSKDVNKRFPGNSDRYCLNLCHTGDMFFDEVSPYLFNNTSEIKSHFKYILDNDGPFLVHCKEGKDHTGVCFILLEGMCGASIDKVMKNYMHTTVNFYNIVPSSDEYRTVEKMMLDHIVCLITHPDMYENCLSIDWKYVDISEINIHESSISHLKN